NRSRSCYKAVGRLSHALDDRRSTADYLWIFTPGMARCSPSNAIRYAAPHWRLGGASPPRKRACQNGMRRPHDPLELLHQPEPAAAKACLSTTSRSRSDRVTRDTRHAERACYVAGTFGVPFSSVPACALVEQLAPATTMTQSQLCPAQQTAFD